MTDEERVPPVASGNGKDAAVAPTDMEESDGAFAGAAAEPGGGREAYDAQIDDLKDKYLRLAAEFDNYKKRIAREHERQLAHERERVLRDWLEVADSVERALACCDDRDTVWARGTQGIMKQIRDVLGRWHVKPIESDGAPFDSSRHEAVGAVPHPGRTDKTVVHTERTGYEIQGGRVLRPARVIVVKNC